MIGLRAEIRTGFGAKTGCKGRSEQGLGGIPREIEGVEASENQVRFR
jgi:hypothetical protein